MTDSETTPAAATTPPKKATAGAIKTFSCPSCGGSVGIRAVGTTITAVCQSCGSLIDVANENVRLIQEAAVKVRKSAIPLGARGVLVGTEWEVIGYSIRQDNSGYTWREYLLFNPYQGFRFLVESDGHWTFVQMLRQQVDGRGTRDTLDFEGEEYQAFARGGAKVIYVMGEFYWRVKLNEKVLLVDYIAPPYILSMEHGDGDIVWSQGVYIRAEEIKDAFKLVSLPTPDGIAPNQPSPFPEKLKPAKLVALVACGILFAVQMLWSSHMANQSIYHRNVLATPNYKGQILLADPLTVPGGHGNLEIRAYSPVANNWVELNVSLANDATQESEEVLLPVEYYYGSDSDGAWQEGHQQDTEIISAVPAGQYHLLVEPDAGAFTFNAPVTIDIEVIRDVPIWGNFMVALLLLIAYPFYLWMRSRYFETQRWSNSDSASEHAIFGKVGS